jgi:hypothetical protein
MHSCDVLRVDSVQRLHHLDAEAGTVTEEHGELGHQLLRACFLKSPGITSFPDRQTPYRLHSARPSDSK